MNTLFGITAAPTAANAVLGGANGVLGAISRPFGQFFQSAVEQGDGTAGAKSSAAADEATSLQERLSQRLQELLQSLGAEEGEEASIRFDQNTNEIQVDGHHSAAAIEAAIKGDSQLTADLQRLAKLHSEFDPAVSSSDWELEARVAESGGALLRWR